LRTLPAILAADMNFPLPRRRFLKTAFCSSAALALNLRPRMVSAAEQPGDLHLLMIGDFGSGAPAQSAVAGGMKTYLERQRIKPEWLLLLGDNFYKNTKLGGGLSAARWKSGFENMYPASVFNCPCPAVLGNHDYHDTKEGEKMQLAYAKAGGTRWTMPAKWYRMELRDVATFLFIDTNLRSVSSKAEAGEADPDKKVKPSLTAAEEEAQWKWLRGQLATKRAPFTFVAGHHPVYSNGKHGGSKELVGKLAPMLQAAGVHFYLCGHDHDLQHLELAGQKTTFVLSGGGGARARELKNKTREMPFGTAVNGFSHLQINAQRAVVRHLDANGKQYHALEKTVDHAWKVVS
jgi:tartrate-resistant acid phosphatase type 5